MPVITISRQFGAAGLPVGEQLATRFGAELLDRAIIAQVALRAGIPEEDLESYDERLPSFWQRITSALASSSPEPPLIATEYGQHIPSASMHERLLAITRGVIEEAAGKGNAVIIGRGAAFILGRRQGTFHVQLHASLDARVRYLMTRVEQIPADARPEEKSLRDVCKEVDAARADYVRRLFGVDWLDARNYDLAIDTGRLGVARTVDLIESVVRGMKE